MNNMGSKAAPVVSDKPPLPPIPAPAPPPSLQVAQNSCQGGGGEENKENSDTTNENVITSECCVFKIRHIL